MTALTETSTPTFSPAELMAKSGVKVDSNTVEVPDIKVGTTPDPAEIVKTDAETAPKAGLAGNTQTASVATPETKPSPPAAKAAEPDWKEFLKKEPETEVLKALGYDDKVIGLLSKWKSGGSVTEYLEAASIDYSKMNSEEVMKRQLRNEYADLNKEDFEELYRMKVTENYKLDPDMYTEQEVRRGQILLNADAKRARESLIAEQQKYILSKPEASATEAEEEARLQAEEEANIKAYRETVEKDPYVTELVKNGALAIGEGDEKFNYTTPKPENLVNLLFDPKAWQQSLKKEDGTPNIPKQMLMAAIADNDTLFLEEYAKHCKAIGARKAVEPIENAVPPSGTPPRAEAVETNPAAALARGGVVVSG